jgi:hypothetical protein
MKKNRKQLVQKLVEEANSISGGGSKKNSYVDDRKWKPTVDKSGNGYAVIRFLPGKDNGVPWTQYWHHGFKGPSGLWYIENSLTTIGQKDPVSEMNTYLWNSGNEDDKALARDRKRKLSYVSNIYVVSDPANPENEGKVFLYEYGKKIFDKLMDVMQPQFEDEDPMNPFDFWEGANFKLKMRNVDGYRNYDKSEFESVSALLDGDDEKLEEVYNKLYDLGEYTDPKNFKSYEDLSRRLFDVLGDDVVGVRKLEVDEPVKESRSAPSKEKEVDVPDVPVSSKSEDKLFEDDDEEMQSFFEKLAAED